MSSLKELIPILLYRSERDKTTLNVTVPIVYYELHRLCDHFMMTQQVR